MQEVFPLPQVMSALSLGDDNFLSKSNAGDISGKFVLQAQEFAPLPSQLIFQPYKTHRKDGLSWHGMWQPQTTSSNEMRLVQVVALLPCWQ